MRAFIGTRLHLGHQPVYVGLSGPVHFTHANLPFWVGFALFFLVMWLVLR